LLIWDRHSFLSKWKNVEYAGSLSLNHKWKLKKIDNNSWHYEPNWTDKDWKQLTIKLFKEKFWLDITDKFMEYNKK